MQRPRASTAVKPRIAVEPAAEPRVALESVVSFGHTGVLPGDVLFVKGNGGWLDVGTTGGNSGHVLVATGPPVRIVQGCPEAQELQGIWPSDTKQIWKVPTVESTRGRAGLCQSCLFLHVEPGTGLLVLIGEIVSETEKRLELGVIEREPVVIWHSPAELRSQLRPDIMADVLNDMVACEGNWSYTTAARAMLQSASLSRRSSRSAFMAEIRSSWDAAPICTSVVIALWQRYLSKFAQATGQSEMDLILNWMPLKADRGLPDELISTLRLCGWISVKRTQDASQPKTAVKTPADGSRQDPPRGRRTQPSPLPASALRSVSPTAPASPSGHTSPIMRSRGLASPSGHSRSVAPGSPGGRMAPSHCGPAFGRALDRGSTLRALASVTQRKR